jgi:hypothetical protein
VASRPNGWAGCKGCWIALLMIQRSYEPPSLSMRLDFLTAAYQAIDD